MLPIIKEGGCGLETAATPSLHNLNYLNSLDHPLRTSSNEPHISHHLQPPIHTLPTKFSTLKHQLLNMANYTSNTTTYDGERSPVGPFITQSNGTPGDPGMGTFIGWAVLALFIVTAIGLIIWAIIRGQKHKKEKYGSGPDQEANHQAGRRVDLRDLRTGRLINQQTGTRVAAETV